MALQVVAHVIAPLPQPLFAVAVPRAALLDDVVLGGDVHEASLTRDAAAVQDVELRLAKRRRDLVLDDLDARPAPHDLLALLEALDATHVHAHAGVKLEGAAARRRLRRAEQDADLLPDLVD